MGDYSEKIGRRGRRASEIPDDGVIPPFQFTEDTQVSKEQKEAFKCDQVWVSGRYTVYVRLNEPTGWSRPCDCFQEVEGTRTPSPHCATCEGSGHRSVSVTHLSIKRNDREAIHDWRDFQIIKNVFCGEESEGIEIYPAEGRLVDTSNQYHLWVFPKGERLPLGFTDGRLVTDAPFGNAKQRPFEVRPSNMPSKAEFFAMALTYCESKGVHGRSAREILGRDATVEEVRAVYEHMHSDDDLEQILIRLRMGAVDADEHFIKSRITIIETIQKERRD